MYSGRHAPGEGPQFSGPDPNVLQKEKEMMILQFTKNISVRWRLLFFISFLLLLLFASGAGGLLGMRSTKQSLSRVYENHVKPMEQLRLINELFKFNVTGTVERLLYEQITEEDATKRVVKAAALFDEKLSALQQESMSNTGDDVDWFTPSKPLFMQARTLIKDLITALQNQDIDKIDSLFAEQLEPFEQEFETRVNALILDRVTTVREQYLQAERRYALSIRAFMATIAAGLLIGLLAGFLLMRSIEEPLARLTKALHIVMQGDLTYKLDYKSQDEFGVLIDGFNQMAGYLAELVSQIQHAGIQVTSSITELAATSKQQEATANEHAATASGIAASTTEIAATSASLMTTMKSVNSLTKNAAYAAENGHAGLSHIDKTMVKMQDATGAIVDKLSILSERATDIASVVKTINKVADQTNLLSLNAAIEAEKAGEYGTGFAVVATEIRRLADQTAVATYDIEQMVQGVQSAVSSAVMAIDKFAEDVRVSVSDIQDGGERIEGVIEHVQVLRPQIASISEGIKAQSLGAKQISESTSQLNEAAQHSAESISQMSITIEQLQQAAQGLQEAVSRFKVT
ncbi:MAG TPA: methyl-accepting chemotaxis protein [Desulfobulbus sp.]|nr:methyl-accepting chemotaxis protein [Desulfobulbus sp.]